MSRVRGLLGSVQMQKQREAGRDRLVVRVETASRSGQAGPRRHARARDPLAPDRL